MATTTGNTTMSTTSSTFGMAPRPNQMRNRGASTTSGMVWLIATSGYSTWRTSRTWVMARASTTPARVPTARPSSATHRVGQVRPGHAGPRSHAARATRPGVGST